YSLNGGKNITFTSNGTINQAEWDLLSDGTISITFYANDTAGNIASKSIDVIKDTSAPNLTIVKPNQDEVFGSAAPTFTVEITDPNLDTMWYSLNGGQNITFTSNGTINQASWDLLSDGTISITFYANDTVGRIASNSVDVIKDTTAPNLTILNPSQDEIFGSAAPTFTVEITDPNLYTMWYSLNGGKNITFTSNGTINQAEWDLLSDGTISITFYANDTAGHIASKSVEVIKEIKVQTGSGEIPSYPLIIFVPMVCILMIGLVLIYLRKTK
ncbi:MAG TPA: hypothetical protein VMV43_05090, partial [Candidatus Nanopelagicaceae bacterium]|nr:hypothetical protein [Candidatus Nanopelagicaceae bacterium]